MSKRTHPFIWSELTKAEYHHQYYLAHKDKWAQIRLVNPEAHRIANKKSWHKRKAIQAPIENQRRRAKHQELRRLVLCHYGGTPPRCACCGEDLYEFLALDHINGGGRKHARSVNSHLYQWIHANNFPSGFRVLCHNCNQSLGAYGYCPHHGPSKIAYEDIPNLPPVN